MDSLITAAARALAAGDPLAALDRVALRDDPPALALRATAMAQLGELARARELFLRAIRAFGAGEPLARARCVVALCEVALASREALPRGVVLEQTIESLAERGDDDNALYGRLVVVRRDLLLGRLASAEARLGQLAVSEQRPRSLAFFEVARAELALRRAGGRQARAALLRARSAAQRAGIALLVGEIDRGLAALDVPAVRCIARGRESALCVEEVEDVLSSTDIVVDACRRCVGAGSRRVRLARRPVLFALARALGEAWPGAAAREHLIRSAFEARRPNDSHRARLRVEIGRLRRLLRETARVEADDSGYRLSVPAGREVKVLLPPIDGSAAELQALLSDGERWSTSMLAAASRSSQRSVQRALSALEAEGRVRSIGRGRAQRWVAPPPTGFTTALLLAGLGSLD